MATNKHAIIRYEALDKCFSNPGRKFFIEDLIEYVSNVLEEYTGTKASVSRRQIFNDIDFMKSEVGFQAPIAAVKEGKRVYYRYENSDYKISSNSLNHIEAELIKTAIDILARFKGLPTFDYLSELSLKLQKSFHLQNLEQIIEFDQNEYLKNINYLGDLLKAIQNKVVLDVVYKPFNQVTEDHFVFHPYFLKQYNRRWFLFGKRDPFPSLSNLALDRILAFNKIEHEEFQESAINISEYFEDIIGVSKPSGNESKLVQIRVNNALWPYIETKPIHPSQKIIQKGDTHIDIQLDIISNYEFFSQMLSFGGAVEILGPSEIREEIKKKIKECLLNYVDKSQLT